MDITNLAQRIRANVSTTAVVSMNRSVRNVVDHSCMLLVADNINYY